MKLFKKALAAVLAGVMALSMVACAPVTPDTPDQPDAPVEDSVATEVLYWMNFGIEKNNTDTTNDFGQVTSKRKMKKIAVDSDKAAKAAIILDLMASENTEIADWSTAQGVVRVSGAAVTSALNAAKLTLALGEINVLSTTAGVTPIAPSNLSIGPKGNYNVTTSALKYPTDATQVANLKAALSTWGVANTVYEDAATTTKVGIASKVINGETYVVVIK